MWGWINFNSRKLHSVNEFDVDYALVLTGDAISGFKIVGGFTDYTKLIIEKYCYNGIKMEGDIIVTDYYDG